MSKLNFPPTGAAIPSPASEAESTLNVALPLNAPLIDKLPNIEKIVLMGDDVASVNHEKIIS